jgi:hypothetical protein
MGVRGNAAPSVHSREAEKVFPTTFRKSDRHKAKWKLLFRENTVKHFVTARNADFINQL